MSPVIAIPRKMVHPYIESVDGVCGGEPIIAGTRISVSLIADLHNKGAEADEVVARYPHLNHAQVYDTLSCYYENREEIDRYIYANTKEGVLEKYKDATWLR